MKNITLADITDELAAAYAAEPPPPTSLGDLQAAVLGFRAIPRLRVYVQTPDDLELLLARLNVRREPPPMMPTWPVPSVAPFDSIPIQVSGFVPAGKVVIVVGDFPNAKVQLLDLHTPEAT